MNVLQGMQKAAFAGVPGAQSGPSPPNLNTLKTVGNGRFQILRKLGAGSFGDIFLGLDTLMKEEVAIKLVMRVQVGPPIKRTCCCDNVLSHV